MINLKKEVKKEDIVYNFLGESYNTHTKHLDRLIIEGKITYTTARLCISLFNYFSTENGRKHGYKLFSISDLRELLKINNKLASRPTIANSIQEIKDNNIFLFDEIDNKKFREKHFAFYTKSEASIKKFEKVKNDLASFSARIIHDYSENNVIFLGKTYIKNDEKDTSNLKSTFNECKINFQPVENQLSTSVKSTFNERKPETIENIIISDFEKNPKETFIKETLYKETFLLENSLDTKEIEKTKKETSFLEHIEKKISVKNENEKIDNSEKEKVINDLKNFGITSNIESLFKFNSIAEIKKQLEYHSFRENKTPGILYNAIKNKETAPAEYKKHLYRIENQNFDKEYSKLIYGVGSSCDENIENKKAYLTHAIISKLYKYGFINTNNSTLNNELQFNYADNENYVIDTLIKPLKTFLENKKLQNLIDLIKEGIELIKKDNAYYLEKPLINDLFNNKGVNIFSIEKAIVKAKNMGV